jgi:cobalt-zinc-cadmium efflux system membrane fusion protein
VKSEEDLFELRHITTGAQSQEQIEVQEGLSPQDQIAMDGAFVLKSEFLKSRFGAGCAHD